MSEDMFGAAGGGEQRGLALARKWRPRAFAEVIGQEQTVRTLTAALASGRLHHAYMFTGTRGVGKTTLARILAKAFNCPSPNPDGTACNACSSCAQIDAGTHPDVLEMDAASTTQVEHMREMLEGLRFAPTGGRYRVCIIDEVHMLSRHSFNAMLKTLEEPPAHVKFILATTDPQQVPATVQSRCLRFALARLAPELIAGHLAHVLDQEGIAFEPAALEVIAAHAEGSVRDALSILDEATASGACLGPAQMRELVGLAGVEHVAKLLELLIVGEVAAALELAAKMSELGVDLAAALGEMGELVHRGQLAAATGAAPAEPALDPLKAQLVFEILSSAQPRLATAPNARVAFEMTLLRIAAFLKGMKRADAAANSAAAAPAAARPAPASGARSEPAPAKSEPSAANSEAAAVAPTTLAKLDAAGWLALASGPSLSDRLKALAGRCEFVAASANSLELRLAAQDEAQLAWRDDLASRLGEIFGVKLKLAISTEAGTGETPDKSQAAALDAKGQQTLERFAASREKKMIEAKLGEIDYDVLPADEQR